MEEMVARWIHETRREYEKAKLNQNVYKMIQMSDLEDALKDMRDRLS
jgi:hypothetical protein